MNDEKKKGTSRYKRWFYFTKSKLKGAFHREDQGTITSLQRGDVWLVSQGFLTVSHSECGSPHWNKDPLHQHHENNILL